MLTIGIGVQSITLAIIIMSPALGIFFLARIIYSTIDKWYRNDNSRNNWKTFGGHIVIMLMHCSKAKNIVYSYHVIVIKYPKYGKGINSTYM